MTTGKLLTLLTDFGTADYYVAAVKGTILRLAPGTALVDIGHEVPPGDIEAAAFLLGAAVPSFPDGTVHLAVVDPGVGSGRRILAVRTSTALFVAPDNGLLTPVLATAVAVHSVERGDLFLTGPGQTFHGRDRFAPVAAFLLNGGSEADLGPRIDDPRRLFAPPPRREPGRIHGRVVHVDRYGNLATDIPASWLPPSPCRAEVAGGTPGGQFALIRVDHYAEIPAGEAALLTGSLGTMELSLNGDDLARRWGVSRNAAVTVVWATER
ncbi:MAG TPA: SAM-dependent chlorinase/fluorinase [Thermoanaerobaculia bacterium]|jgi:S-adenosylmethionine hydrolase|nr:SAM-dependent chlorinase/fluorinase [Thermoanaerobaculia bacterium]